MPAARPSREQLMQVTTRRLTSSVDVLCFESTAYTHMVIRFLACTGGAGFPNATGRVGTVCPRAEG